MTIRMPLTAAVLAGLLVAGPPVAASPVAAARTGFVGLPCSYQPVRDVTDPAGNRWTAELDAGPFVVLDATTSWIAITCTLQTGSATLGTPLAGADSTWSGNVGFMATVVSYRLDPGEPLYICTTIVWRTRSGSTYSYQEDVDASRPGVQCRE